MKKPPFNITVDNFVDIQNIDKRIFLICFDSNESSFRLIDCDKKLFISSDYCKKSAVLVKKSELSGKNINIGVDPEIIPEEFVIIWIPEHYKKFDFKYISEISDYVTKFQYIDKYLLDIDYFTQNVNYNLWFVQLKENARKWVKNSILLSNVEYKRFMLEKFSAETVQNAAQTGNYPAQLINKTPSIKIKQIPENDAAMMQLYTDLIAMLIQFGFSDYAENIVIILMVCPDYCHFVVNNGPLLQLLQTTQIFDKLANVMFYPMRLLYLEEVSVFTGATANHRFIFDNDSAANLPKCSGFLNNPYVPLVEPQAFTEKKQLNLPCFIDGPRGIYPADAFIENVREFAGGNIDQLDYEMKLENIDITVKSALTGSAITACSVMNPLSAYYNTFNDYLNQYYPKKTEKKKIKKSVVSKSNLVFEYESDDDDHVNDIRVNDIHIVNGKAEIDDQENIVLKEQNIEVYAEKMRKDKFDRFAKRKMREEVIMPGNCSEGSHNPQNTGIEEDIIPDVIDDKILPYSGCSDIDIMVETDSAEIFDIVAAVHYEKIKKIYRRDDLVFERVTTENKHKYIIYGLDRLIEIFFVNTIPGTIAKFHLPCVRAWYNGETVNMFPSYVCAAYSSVNCDIRWISCNKDIRDIVMKYFQRGFGTILNMEDRNNLTDYIDASKNWPHFNPPPPNNNRWNPFYRQKLYWRNSLYKSVANIIFNPSMCNIGIHCGLSRDTIKPKKSFILSGQKEINFRLKRKKDRKPGEPLVPIPQNSDFVRKYL